MFREDYLIRMFQEIAEALARIAGLNRRRQYDSALQDAGRTWDELFDVPRDLAERLDTRTLVGMLREPAKMRAASQLIAAEARTHEAKADGASAKVCFRRALALRLEAREREPRPEDEDAI